MERQLRKVLPTAEIKDIPKDHAIFHLFYDIDKIIQLPSLAYVYNGGITWEQDGFAPEGKGVWDEHGRLIMVINHNTALGDPYAWADHPKNPNTFSASRFPLAAKFCVAA